MGEPLDSQIHERMVKKYLEEKASREYNRKEHNCKIYPMNAYEEMMFKLYGEEPRKKKSVKPKSKRKCRCK